MIVITDTAMATPPVNADLVREAGHDPAEFPTDWESLIALGAAIDALGADHDGIYDHFWGSDWMWQAALGSFGGRPMTEDTHSPDRPARAAVDRAGLARGRPVPQYRCHHCGPDRRGAVSVRGRRYRSRTRRTRWPGASLGAEQDDPAGP